MVHDIVEKCLFYSIHDNGTELAQYEGADYGNGFLIHPTWSKD
jgi:hypothetical protein